VETALLSGSTHDQPACRNEAIDTVEDPRSLRLRILWSRIADGNATRAPASVLGLVPPTPAEAVRSPQALVAATIQAYNEHDLDRLAELHDPSARIKFAGVDGDIGLEGWWSSLDAVFTMLPDFTLWPLTVLADDQAAMIEMNLTGTNTGEIPLTPDDQRSLGLDVDRLPPTGRLIEVAGVVVLRTADGLVTRETHHWPRHWLDEGLGLVTVEARPRGLETSA
jgi:hypothetical protein